MSRPADPGRFAAADAAVVAGACLAACAVRVPLALQSLWYDEIASYLGYGIRGTGFALTRMYTQANHVLQTVLSAWCVETLGPTEWAMRLPSFLAGLATIPAAWMLGNEAGGPRLGRAAAVAAALMPIAALEATESRGYALMALFATLCTALFLRGLRAGGTGTWALYALCAGLGTWSHLVTTVVPVFHGLWTLAAIVRAPDAAARRALRAPLAATLAAGAAGLLAVAPFLRELLAIRGEFLALDGNEPRLLGPEGWMMLLGLGGSWTWWASLAAAPVVAAGAWACRARPALRRALVLAAGGALVALAAPLVGSWLYARFLAFLVPAVALAAGAGALALADRAGAAGARAARTRLFTVPAALAALAWTWSLGTLPPRQPLREASQLVIDGLRRGETALAVGLPDPVQGWYPALEGLELPSAPPNGRDFAPALAASRAARVLVLYPRAMPAGVFDALRDQGYVIERSFPGWIDQGGGELRTYVRRTEAGPAPAAAPAP